MNKKYIKCLFVLLGFLLSGTSCVDKFAEINTNPGSSTTTEPSFLFTSALSRTNMHEYLLWFYNYPNNYLPWSQLTYGAGEEELNRVTIFETQLGMFINIKREIEEIKFLAGQDATDPSRYDNLISAANALQIMAAIYSSDMYGTMPYTEAGRGASYLPNSTLRPRYESPAELYETWLNELDDVIEVLSGNNENQVALGTQDFVYQGDYTKWLKFANSLKLRIAARMINVDKAEALRIASEVGNLRLADGSYAIMSGLSDDFIWNRSTEDYNTGNGIDPLNRGSKTLIEFLVENRDPRLRVVFTKNEFNSQIVQAFFDADKALPSYIDRLVESRTEDGRKEFVAWRAPGEPWVRFFGRPIDFDSRFEGSDYYEDYFDPRSFEIVVGGSTYSYEPQSFYNEEMLRGQKDFTFPVSPGGAVYQDNDDRAWHTAYLSTAEVNLFLAEFKLLGADLPLSAQEYLSDGIRASVELYDYLAGMNAIPYYNVHAGFDPFDETIALKDGEIDYLLAQPVNNLTGALGEDLEKVYINQYIHFMYWPNELFMNVKRSGIPMNESQYLSRVDLTGDGSEYIIPRRFPVDNVLASDLLYDIKVAAYQNEGFTIGAYEPEILATERLWNDRNNPDYGAGPNY